jgi:phosphoribosylformimino-5-aminoimidazole carboxamide ribotide isomerase
MEVIPVIDLRGGAVVAARRGDRSRYRPLETPLAASADPVAVALGLRSHYPFPTLYVADLDSIEGRGADRVAQRRLAECWPGELWIDGGTIAREDAGGGTVPLPSVPTNVIGSESLASLEDYRRAHGAAGPRALLSLDFRGDDFIGPPGLLDDASIWPGRVIVMTLARVGSGEGPDTRRLAEIVARAGARRIYAAGGVRHVADLRALRAIGVAGALVATSLHDGRLSRRDLEELTA